MFQHFHTGHNIILVRLFFSQLLYRNLAVLNILHIFLLGMQAANC